MPLFHDESGPYRSFPLHAYFGDNRTYGNVTLPDIIPYMTHLQVESTYPDITGKDGYFNFVLKFQIRGLKQNESFEIDYNGGYDFGWNIEYDSQIEKKLIELGYKIDDFYWEQENYYHDEDVDPDEDRYYEYITPPKIKIENSNADTYYYVGVYNELFVITKDYETLKAVDEYPEYVSTGYTGL